MALKIEKTKIPKSRGGGVDVRIQCDKCGADYRMWSYGWGASDTNNYRNRHRTCKMRRVCSFCDTVLDEGTEYAATTHGICDACYEKEIAEQDELESEVA